MPKLIFKDNPHAWRTGSDFPSVPLTAVSFDDSPDTVIAYVFFGHVNIDFDGSPTAYGPAGIDPPPDDDLSNAGDAQQGWYGLVALNPDDPAVQSGDAVIDQRPEVGFKGRFPVVQQEGKDPAPGYYVSATPHPTGLAYRQDSYIDASEVPYGALSGQLKGLGVALGDYGLAIRHDQSLQSRFYFADSGGAQSYALGECSHRVGKDLGGSGRGNRFNNNYPVSFLVFPQTGTQDPSAVVTESDDQIAAEVKKALGGLAQASNAADLALLMGFNETAPPGRPKGTSKLTAYQQDPDNGTKPENYDNLMQGLTAWGYAI